MVKKTGVTIVAVVEDQQLERFVRRALGALGFDRHEIYVRSNYPKRGSGSGKRYVEQQYRKEIVTLRRKSRENRALLLGKQTVDARVRVLDKQVEDIGQARRDSGERIVYWIPKRHVETWGLHLTGVSVDEATDYHHRGDSIDWRRAGGGFHAEYLKFRNGAASPLPSLNQAYQETQRLKL